MRILFLAQLLPYPLDAGPKVRAHYVLRHLADVGHDVTLLCYRRSKDRDDAFKAVGRFCREVHEVPLTRTRLRDVRDGIWSLISRQPFLLVRDRRPALDNAIDRLTRQRHFDAIHVDQLWMAPAALQYARVGVRVLDQHNAVFRVAERLAAHATNPVSRALLRSEASKLAAYERRAIEQFNHVVWVSRNDCEAVCDGRSNGARHAVIPIAVDTARPVSPLRPNRFRVTFIGGLQWPPNADAVRWFITSVWSKITARVPDGLLTIIGGGALRGLSGAGMSRIEMAGYIEDVAPYLSETAVFIVPIRAGAGVRVKILDAWCCGLPVVSTSIGAEGLASVHGENLLIADDEDSFAEHVVEVLRNGRLAQRLGANGRVTVESQYDWRHVYSAWDRIYQ